MRTTFTLALILSIITHGYSGEYDPTKPKKPKGCTTSYCSDWDWKNKKGLFDPHTIHWPLHYTGKTYLDYIDGGDVDIDVVYHHYGHKTRQSLKEYRKSSYHNDPWFLDKGIKMNDPFTCDYWVEDSPKWKANSCAMIDDTFEDHQINFDGPSCSKVIRTWTIIDWCKWEPNGIANTKHEKYTLVKDKTNHSVYWSYGKDHYDIEHDGWYTFDQVIKILDHDAPEFYHCEDIEYDLEGTCETKVKVTNKVVDSGPCPGKNMEVELKVIDEDGQVFSTNWVHAKHKVAFDVNLGYMQAGNYKIHWTVKDGCGNKGECYQKLKVIDKNPPHIICFQDLSTAISDDSGASIWAKDFVHKVTGACYDEHLTYSFSKDSLVPNLTFTCPDGVGLNELEVFATGSNGVTASCNTTIFVADHSTCDPDAMQIAGIVEDKFGNPINNVEVMIESEARFITSGMTNDQGRYGVAGITFDLGRPHIVAKAYEDDAKKALDAVDLIYMLRHIQDIEKLEKSDQRAAADVNSDGAIDMEDYWDLIDIIYEIPGREAEIQTWKFYDEKTGLFAGFDHMQLVRPVKLARFRRNYSLIGLKTGDIDFSWRPEDAAGGRSAQRSSEYSIVSEPDFTHFNIQIPAIEKTMSLSLDAYNWSYDKVESVLVNGDDIPFIITEVDGSTVLVVMSKEDISGQILTVIGSQELLLEGTGKIYESNDAETKETDWVIQQQLNSDHKALVVSPNPFSEHLNLSLFMAENTQATIEIFTIHGQLLQRRQVYLNKGQNETRLSTEELNSGIHLVVFRTPNNTITKRIIKN